jgi:hypothetical protein
MIYSLEDVSRAALDCTATMTLYPSTHSKNASQLHNACTNELYFSLQSDASVLYYAYPSKADISWMLIAYFHQSSRPLNDRRPEDRKPCCLWPRYINRLTPPSANVWSQLRSSVCRQVSVRVRIAIRRIDSPAEQGCQDGCDFTGCWDWCEERGLNT